MRACTLFFVYQFFSISSITDPSAFDLLRAMSFRIRSLMYPCLLPTCERWSSMSASVDFCSFSFTCTVLSLSHSAAAFVLPISHHLACVCPPYVHYDITVYTACQHFSQTFFKIFFASLYAFGFPFGFCSGIMILELVYRSHIRCEVFSFYPF